MSREPKRMEENVRGSSRLIVYITVAVVIAIVMISYIIISNMIENKREEQRLAEIESTQKQEEQEIVISQVENQEVEGTKDRRNTFFN